MSEEERDRLHQPEGGSDAPPEGLDEEILLEMEARAGERDPSSETNQPRRIVDQIKERLLVEEGVGLLQALSRAITFLQEKPEFDDDLKPAVELALESPNPWARRNAERCLIDMKERRKGRQGTTKSLSGKVTTPKERYVELIVKRGRDKAYFRERLLEVCHENGIVLDRENAPSNKELVEKLVETRNLKYLFRLFTKREAIKIAHATGVKITEECNDETKLHLKIYEKIGIKLDRSDYLEI